MALFTKRQTDESWSAEINPSFEAAISRMSKLNVALDTNSHVDHYNAVQGALEYLPLVQKAVKQIGDPSSPQARQVHRSFKLALKNYVDGAKQGLTFFRDMSGGPGKRAAHETGMAKRAAVARLVFNQSMFMCRVSAQL